MQDDVLVYDNLGSVPCYLSDDIGEILGGDVHLPRIIVDIP